MSGTVYRIEWSYLSELADGAHPNAEAHCSFLLRFTDTPPGPGHCAFFGVNVATPEKARELGVEPEGRRGYFIAATMTQGDFQQRVEREVAAAFLGRAREAALELLDETYVLERKDYRDEFGGDARSEDAVRALIESAFAGVTRGKGVTLHEAIADDDYAGPEERAAARMIDADTDWHHVPLKVLSRRHEFLTYLDAEGLRYYLPAAMCFSLSEENRVSSETPQRTYWRLLPVVAPRDFGKGHGRAFESESLIASCAFTDAQVRAIYAFLCFMAAEGGEGVDEEQLPALRKWRESAQRRG